jgi:hypothetical protein
LPLRVRAQVGFEAERVDDGYEGREHVQRRARARPFGSDMAASPAEYSVNGRDAIWFVQSRVVDINNKVASLFILYLCAGS